MRRVLIVLAVLVGTCSASAVTADERGTMTRFALTKFQLAFENTMIHEVGNAANGGLVNDPRDPGGLTQWGLSKRANPDLPIGNMTKEQAAAVYKKRYWDAARLDEVESVHVAMEVFDTGVNMGVGRAVKIAQEATNLLGKAYNLETIPVDGRMGPLTLKALNHWTRRDPVALLAVLNGLQFVEYMEVLAQRPSLIYATRAWMRRCVPAGVEV